MSISTTTRKAGPFTGNGSTVSFPFAFKVFAAADVLVVRGEIATAAELPLTLGTHYSVTLNADQNVNPGGTVNWIGTPLSSAYTLVIGSKVASTQPATFTNLGRFYPRVLNDALDRLTIVVQQLAEEVSRSVKVGFSGLVSPDQLVSTITTAASTATAGAASAAASAETALEVVTDALAAVDAANAAIEGVVRADGSVPMTSALTLAGNASSPLHAMPLQQATGRLLAVRQFVIADTGTTYTPTPGTTSVIVEAVGGGGAGGGAQATSSIGISCGAGGGAGAHALARFTSAFSGVTLTIGAAGVGSAGANGGAGGTTSFGALLSCPGGAGGDYGGTASNTSTVVFALCAEGSPPSGTSVRGAPGAVGENGLSFSGVVVSGAGGGSAFGSGGSPVANANGANAANSTRYGAGGGGAANGASQSARAGGDGAPGAITVWEYA